MSSVNQAIRLVIIPCCAIERLSVDICDGVGDGHIGQARAVIERPVTDGCYGVTNGHTG